MTVRVESQAVRSLRHSRRRVPTISVPKIASSTLTIIIIPNRQLNGYCSILLQADRMHRRRRKRKPAARRRLKTRRIKTKRPKSLHSRDDCRTFIDQPRLVNIFLIVPIFSPTMSSPKN